MDILKLLDELDDLAKNSNHFPLTNKALINETEFQRIVHSIRKEFPSALNEAAIINSQKEQIIAEAQTEAESIINNARNYAENMVNKQVIVQKAQEQATFIINKANGEAETIIKDALNYIQQVFGKLDDNVGSIHKSVKEARHSLSSIDAKQFLQEPAKEE